VEIPDELTRERVKVDKLSSKWRDPAAPPELAHFGDEFAQRAESCLPMLPSVLAPSENNCLINRVHSDCNRIAVLELETLRCGPRMFGKQHSRHQHPKDLNKP
jgi:RES domain-containing protein